MKTLPFINPKHEKEKIVKFLKKTFKEQKINRVVLGLSGGIDSMTVLFLLSKSLSTKNIFPIHLSYYQPNIDILEKTVKDLGIPKNNFLVIPIKKPVDQFKLLTYSRRPSRIGIANEEKIRLGNIMARVRMIILFDLAKKLNAMVCGTENKSEKLLGYFTRFGDAASDIEPISHLYKTQVLQLAKYLKVPKKIIQQSPTAGLWNGQTDEGEFGFTYEEADQVLYLTHDPTFVKTSVDKRGQDINKVKKITFPNAEKIIKRFQDNQFKLKTPYKLD